MKPQTRPFTVETKTRRRLTESSHANWSAVIDEPPPDDVPSRDVRGDASSAEADPTPLAVANRMFSALTTNAISTAASFAGAAANVFASKQQAGEDLSPAAAPAADQGRTGRILPSLLPVNPFEDAPVEKAATKGQKRAPSKPRERAGKKERPPASMPVLQSADLSIPEQQSVAMELSAQAAPVSARKSRRARARIADRRVPAGERWKRRRLPKVLW
jgi:hypothetical protein